MTNLKRNTSYQIDQSGKIEQTNMDTVLCIANGSWDTILVRAKTKRAIHRVFRENNQIRNYVLFTFSAVLVVLIERNINVGRIIIDREYYGKESIITSIIEEMSEQIMKKATIQFGLIGKSSNADLIAGEVFIRKRQPNIVLAKDSLMRVIRRTKVGLELRDA